MNFIQGKNIGFMGSGKMAQSIIRAFIDSKTVKKEQIFITNRSDGKREKVAEHFGITGLKNNEDLIAQCDVIFLCMKPQDMIEALTPIAIQFDESHTVISLAAGISLKSLKKVLANVSHLVRVMPNTPVRIAKGVIGYCLSVGAKNLEESIREFLKPLGVVVQVDEGEQFEALTVSCGSGTGFIFELMVYWQDWLEEHGFGYEEAREMTVQTFLGAALLASQSPKTNILQLQEEVVSKKGVTASGLDSMRELDIETALRISFEKAVLRDQEIGKTLG